MPENLCKLINTIDNGITVNVNNSKAMIEFDNMVTEYCTEEKGGRKKECFSYELLVTSFFTTLLKYFENDKDKNNLEKDKLAQYATLWLCHKLNKNLQNGINNLNDVYNKYIKGNKEYFEKINGGGVYNSYEDFINKKQDMVNVNIKDMSKFYEALQILCKLYTGCNEKKKSYTNCLQDAKDFAKHFEGLNQDYNITENNLYREILFSLSTDYDDLKNVCAKNCSSCNDIPTLSGIKAPPSSSIASKLIPVLLAFSISIFLGVAYKYSLFGFDKRFRRQYSREKLKK
ncbi:CIR protein [Plasmodium chabaudi adami]|uniref:CIR protein n=1 Tax=Plasmodium chabaudi adami TaxID=5826 RepID=A0A1D3LAE3_PLACE|nr:CIR protein [Plasmodium chabaudi adami]